MKENEFKCAMCGGVFEKGWTDEEATAEAVSIFGEHREDDAIVCDDCWNEFMGIDHAASPAESRP